MNLKNKDIIPYLGSALKVSEILNGQRSLSLSMIRKLVTGLGISAEVLIREPENHQVLGSLYRDKVREFFE